MRRLFSGGKAPATAPAPSSSSAPPDSIGTSSSAPPPLADTNPIPMTSNFPLSQLTNLQLDGTSPSTAHSLLSWCPSAKPST